MSASLRILLPRDLVPDSRSARGVSAKHHLQDGLAGAPSGSAGRASNGGGRPTWAPRWVAQSVGRTGWTYPRTDARHGLGSRDAPSGTV